MYKFQQKTLMILMIIASHLEISLLKTKYNICKPKEKTLVRLLSLELSYRYQTWYDDSCNS